MTNETRSTVNEVLDIMEGVKPNFEIVMRVASNGYMALYLNEASPKGKNTRGQFTWVVNDPGSGKQLIDALLDSCEEADALRDECWGTDEEGSER